ncbi:hypothetical protein OU997_09335 [Pseudomonas sp. SL4(2022)]|uniref:hypothetical protein n=1 Tax=Pseudomonas sp. SL4(2022) TaxID=2994661 RepID=UPI0022714B70|nr:hypothetical protein [Pseudomonas sp. SL4(2022)]WAC46343.1 hypothetical protein OU997_09335 [Pseudomonas sp. SL4(2022)]
MRCLSTALISSVLLSGCASPPQDPSGTWINQAAIDDAVERGNLREALLAYGPNLEWQIDGQRRLASFSNGFERGEGTFERDKTGPLRVHFYGDFQELLSLSNGELIQAQSDTWPEQRFVRAPAVPGALAPPGSSFEQALYGAYLGGTWLIKEGLGEGGLVLFQADGSVQGLPGAERYALCLAGDCAAMSGEFDSLWLQLGDQGQNWLFERKDDELRVFEALNSSQIDEMPNFYKGQQRWLLQQR